MKRFVWGVFLLASVGKAWGQDSSQSFFRIQPSISAEHTTMRYPEPPKSTDRTLFGLSVQFGRPLLAGEAELQAGHNERSYTNQKVKDSVTRGSLGLRTTIPATSLFSLYSRGGLRASWERTDVMDTTTGVTTNHKPPALWDPYAGAGLQIHLGAVVTLSAGATWYFPQGGGSPSVQYTFGFMGAGF